MTARQRVTTRAGLIAALAVGFAQSGCVVQTDEGRDDGDAVRIGALLPYTGELAASGANIEHAILWAAEQVNDAGGVAGRPVRIIARDSNSSVDRGMQVARSLIEDEKVVAIIGPEYEDLAREMLPLVTEHDVLVVSGGVTSPRLTTLDTEEYFFRTTPTAVAFGSVLADAAYADGVRRLAILYVSDEYGKGFASAVNGQFERFEGTTVERIPFAPGASSYRELVSEASEFDPDGIALVAYPRSGATIVSDWAALGKEARWYFSHTLRSDEFVKNVPPGTIDGMIGTSHSLPPGDATVFRSQFERRWPGDTPLTPAFFNYDALAVLLLAIEEAAVENQTTGVPSASQIREHIQTVSSNSRGKVVSWHDLDYGLHLLREKDVPAYGGIDYRGASGFVDLNEHGDVVAGLVQIWSVRDGRIVGGGTAAPVPLSGE